MRVRYSPLVVGVLALTPLLACGDSTSPQVPADIVITPNHPVVPQGLTLALSGTVVDASGRRIAGRQPVFRSADTTIARVTAGGLVTSVGPLGTVRITAEYGGITNFVDLEIAQRIIGIGVTPNPVVMNTGTTVYLQVSIVDFAGNPVAAPGSVIFTSSNPTVATVDLLGAVTSHGTTTGSLTITVQADTFDVQVPVTVTQIPTTLTVSPQNLVLAPGGTAQLTSSVRDLTGRLIAGLAATYTGTAPGVFSVSSSGRVTAAAGTGSGWIIVSADTLRDTVGVFVGAAPPGTILQTTPVPGPAYAAAIAPGGATIVSLASGSAVMRGTLPSLGFSDTLAVDTDPLGVAIDPTGARAYVALRGTNRVALVDLATDAVTYPAPAFGNGSLLSVIVSNDGQQVFAGTDYGIYRLDPTTLAVLDSLPSLIPLHLAVHPTLPLLYVGENGSGYVREVDWTTMTVVRSFGPGSGVQAVAVSGDGSTLYAANEYGPAILSWNLATGQPGVSFAAPGTFGLATAGSVLYATIPTPGQVLAFDRVSGTPLYTRPVGGTPRRPAILPGGGVLMVPNESGWVDYIQ